MTTPSDDPNQPPSYPQQGFQSYPSAPPPQEAPRQTYAPPSEITAAFWCYIAGAVITVIGGLLVLTQRQAIVDAARANNTGNLPDSTIQTAANIAVGFAIVLSLVFAGLYILFAFKLRVGRNWARIVLTIVAVLALLSLLLGATSILRLIGDLAAIAGAVLSYVPNSNAYIAAMKRTY